MIRAKIVDIDAVRVACAFEPIDLVGHLIRPIVPGLIVDPPRRAPRKPVSDDIMISFLRLSHQPKLITSITVHIVPGVHVRRFGAVCGLGVAPNLDFADVQVGAKVGLHSNEEEK